MPRKPIVSVRSMPECLESAAILNVLACEIRRQAVIRAEKQTTDEAEWESLAESFVHLLCEQMAISAGQAYDEYLKASPPPA